MSHEKLPAYACLCLRKKFTGGLVFAVILCLVIAGLRDAAAQDTTAVKDEAVVVETFDSIDQDTPDTVRIKSYADRFDPRKAILYAAVLPGLGQVYNKKYWKLPLVYGGFFFIGYYIKTYNDLYTEYKGHLFFNLENGLRDANDENPNVDLTTSQLRRIVDQSRRERDFMIILMGGMYILQMVDAHVDAHLKEFDLNPRLQVSIEPNIEQNMMTGRTTGFAVVLKF